VNASQRWPSRCAAPGCHVALPDYNGRGRPRLYCSPRCRSAGRGARSNTPLSVEIDHTVASDAAGRPIGRVWLVRLRRGAEEVIVASELGRPTADHLAGQIAQLIDGRQRAPGAAME